jgi:hypothetical protein
VKRIIVFGASGVFGSHVARELVARGLPITVAGRSLAKAEASARSLGSDCRALAADVTEPQSCRSVLEGFEIAVNCAGPFNRLGTTLLEACLEARCHYVDITDDRDYAATVREYDQRFRDRGLAAIYGCSSLPGISGAIALRALNTLTHHESPAPEVSGGHSAAESSATARPQIDRARVTLFIGNNNPKGQAAVGSLVAQLGRPIRAPQGIVRGFRDREVVPLPEPFGSRAVFNFESPEYDLFPKLVGAKSVSAKVGFEFRIGTYAFAFLAWLGLGYGRRTARMLDLPCHALSWFGHSGGVVMAELFAADGRVSWASLGGRDDGQRMAALPCAIVAHSLASYDPRRIGVSTAYEYFGAEPLLAGLQEKGFELREGIRKNVE